MTEKELVLAAQRGDDSAFEALVQAYEKKVYHLALRMCGNAHDAEEVAQEAFVAAWKGMPAFRGESKFSSWLYQLTTNAAIDFLRREKRHRGTTPIEDEVDLADLARTAFILDMDTTALCSEDCQGLCPGCGVNLNEEPCRCKKQVDPRLAALAKLLQDD